jgi:hypothetical protein
MEALIGVRSKSRRLREQNQLLGSALGIAGASRGLNAVLALWWMVWD